MKDKVTIGVDVGTTSVKVVLFTLKGDIISEKEEMITTHHPKQGYAEQDPLEIEKLAIKAIHNVLVDGGLDSEDILSIGLSTAMHSLICVDDKGMPLANMMIWSDGRSKDIALKLKKTDGPDIYKRTGTPIHPMTPLCKLLWMKEKGDVAYKNAAYFMTFKDFLMFHWFGERVIDFAMASSTGFMDVHKKEWDLELLDRMGIRKEQLAEIVGPTTIYKNLKSDIALKMGFTHLPPFVIASADGQLANLGSGAIDEGEVAISAGTSGAIRQFADGSPVSDAGDTFTYAFDQESSIIGGPTNNGGIVMQWLKNMLEFTGDYDSFLKEAEKVEPGADGLIFLPYVNGERAPLWNQDARGNFFGLHVTHKRPHMIRAALEGLTFNIYQMGKTLEKLAGKPVKISVNGGLSKSPLWLQMLADIFDLDIHVSNTHHNVAWGVAWTSLVAVGQVESFQAIKGNLPEERVISPNKENVAIYREVYEKYAHIQKHISTLF